MMYKIMIYQYVKDTLDFLPMSFIATTFLAISLHLCFRKKHFAAAEKLLKIPVPEI